MIQSLKTLIVVFRDYRWHLCALVLFGTLAALLEGIGINIVVPLVSFFTGGAGVTDTDFITSSVQKLFSFIGIPFTFRFLLGFILVLFILRAVCVISFAYIRGWIGADFLARESEEVLESTLTTSWPYLLKQKIGTVQNTLVRDVQLTGDLLSVVAQVVQSFTGFLIYLLVAFNISPLMTTYTLIGGLLVMLFLRPLFSRVRIIGGRAALVEKDFTQFLSEHIIGMKSIKAAGSEQLALVDGTEHIKAIRGLSVRQAFIRSLSSGLFQPASLIIVIILFILTYNTPGFNIISFAATLYLIQKIFTYLESGQGALLGITQQLPYAENVTEFKRQLRTHSEESIKGGKPFIFKKSLDFNKVSFSYVDGIEVLHDVSFSIAYGKTTALIGPSGSGKTSVVDLVLRLFTPNPGSITVDSVPATDMSLEEWRKSIGYVSQEVFLLNRSISENIRFYNHHITDSDVEEAAKAAHIYDFIKSLPEGFDTVTGDRGVMLSGGQRQRIALARALARKPQLLVLDEATSALDTESERQVQKAIDALQGKVTVLTIAHRLTTIEHADTIIVLDGGRIVEEGSPAELGSKPDSYYRRHKA